MHFAISPGEPRMRPVTEMVPNPVFAAPHLNRRPLVLVAPREAPAHPREVPAPARPARMPVHVFTAIGAFQAVSSLDNFITGRGPRPKVSQPKGRMTPMRTRGNIARPTAEAFGSQFELAPGGTEGWRLVPRRFAGVPG